MTLNNKMITILKFKCGKTTAGEWWSSLFEVICIIQYLTFVEVDNNYKDIQENVAVVISQ